MGKHIIDYMLTSFSSKNCRTNSASTFVETQLSSSTYVFPPKITMSSISSNVKHSNSIRKKGRFRVRKVNRMPEALKDNLHKESSSSPVKSVTVTINENVDNDISISHSSISSAALIKNEKADVVVYNVSKLFKKNYDIILASKYYMDESGMKR